MQSVKKICVIDFGGQYSHLISSRIRRLGAFTEILANNESLEKYREFNGIILSGGPESVYDVSGHSMDTAILDLGIPVLGICYGHQLIMKLLGGKVERASISEYGKAEIKIKDHLKNSFTIGLGNTEKVWMSHGDEVVALPPGFIGFAETAECKYAGVMNPEKGIYGIQFHPEVTHTVNGNVFLKNFIKICGIEGSWSIETFYEQKLIDLKNEIPENKNVFMLISGGVDSTVAYLLLAKALGHHRVKGLLIDTGFMRKNEIIELKAYLLTLDVDLNVKDYAEKFYSSLASVTDPETKRKIIGDLFIESQDEAVKELGLDDHWLLGQGTIYPDTIESGGTKHSHTIKTHHNRVDIILKLIAEGKVVEPVKDLYKDEVRALGNLLGLPEKWTARHPFPGPGLAVRIIQSQKEYDTDLEERLTNFLQKFKDRDFQGKKPFLRVKATILPILSVGVKGDRRSYANCVAFNDFTDDWDLYDTISTAITNSFTEINRVVFLPFSCDLSEQIFHEVKLDKFHSDLLREADFIANQFILENHLLAEIWQMPVVLLPAGPDKNNFSIVLRPVESSEAMTANFYRMDRQVLEAICDEIKKINGIAEVFYDITNKPPGTIEWE